jgi:NTP pyrophosphatase (non-canonical NTP hydrolase)
MAWLNEFAETAEKTDRFKGKDDHLRLLAAGLMGEAGSVLTELKKAERERNAYPAYRRRMVEEVGDFLWYLTRIISVVDRDLLLEFENMRAKGARCEDPAALRLFLDLGAVVGEVLAFLGTEGTNRLSDMRPLLRRVWTVLVAVAEQAQVELQDAAVANARKIESRWPRPDARIHFGLFDDGFPEEEQLPRKLTLEFRERVYGNQRVVFLRCNGINFGDRLTDNIEDPDDYRYHDIFHFAHAVHLGWSPVVRALLRCKRKSNSKKDEGQDGARAVILEEAVAAIVFSRAKEMSFFDGIDHVDYDLLKIVREFIQGYEVDKVPLWQWEAAIIDGYATFRRLRDNKGGTVTLDLIERKLTYLAPTTRG